MPFLSLNGWSLPIRDGGVVTSRMKRGDASRSPRGRMRSSRRDFIGEFAATTIELEIEDAEALEGLIDGAGHAWHFDGGLMSTNGLGPEPGASGAVPQFGYSTPSIRGGLIVTQASFALRYNVQFSDGWTVQWREYNGTTWRVCALTSSGKGYIDGVSTAGVGSTSTALSVAVVDGVLELGYTGVGTLSELTDVAAVPYEFSASLAASLSASVHSFSPLPRIKLSGDLVGGRRYVCVCRVTRSDVAQYRAPSGWQSNRKRVAFSVQALYEYEEPPTITGDTFYILQENGDKLLQENGDGLIQEY